MIKAICIKKCWSYKSFDVIDVNTVYYTPITDIDEAYTNWISIFMQDDIKTFLGTYCAKYFCGLASFREYRINKILGDE